MGITSNFEVEGKPVFPNHDIFSNSEEMITFANSTKHVCVGVVDVVSSTKITAKLSSQNISKYYGIFLNTLGAVIAKYRGKIVKNIGDSILYYFEDDSEESKFARCLECNLAMLQIHDYLNMKLKSQGLPHLDYRISSDYGAVAIAKTTHMTEDIFGQPVNICAKINSLAQPNSLVIGSDFYEAAKGLECYKFESISSFSSGLKYTYPVYSARHNDSKIRAVVANCIEKMLLEMGAPHLEEVVKRLYNKHNCFLFDCYVQPDALKQVLMELYGDAGSIMTKTIEQQMDEHILPKPVKEFLVYLKY